MLCNFFTQNPQKSQKPNGHKLGVALRFIKFSVFCVLKFRLLREKKSREIQ